MTFNPRISAGDRRYPSAADSAQVPANGALIASQAGWLYSLSGYNGGPAQYIQIHDVASTPADSSICLLVLPVPAAQWWYFDFAGGGIRFFRGLYVCNSSTDFTKTIGLADCQFLADYRLKTL